jgi:hypothetical protein
MKRQNVVLMLFLAVLLVASTAESTELENARQTVVLECGVVMPDDTGGGPGPFPPPEPAMQQLEPTRFLGVIAVSGTPDAPEISIGEQCGIAIGKLMNSRFRLLSATPAAYGRPGATPDPDMVTNVPSVQYLFVSKPEPRWSLR